VEPLYQRYLSVSEFTARFGPLVKDYKAVAAYAKANGLVLDLKGLVSNVDRACDVSMGVYHAPHGESGRLFHRQQRTESLPKKS
jgi:subtilase family serine protease